jgi:hypothetical protein
MPNGRCRLHGGLSTGPRTAEGIERIRRAVSKHGRYSKAAKIESEYVRSLMKEARAALTELRVTASRNSPDRGQDRVVGAD